jgi:type II secretory pathway pseudopilin PulG
MVLFYKTMKKNILGFTLMEIMIVVGLIALVAATIVLIFNPLQQINKAQDSRKKSELGVLKNVLDDFYNDKSCYPKPTEICYNAKSSYVTGESISCNICGKNSSSPSLKPYLASLPCDPQSPKKDYLYEVDDQTCPKWFRIYSKLNNESDPVISDLACDGGACGPKPSYGFNFGLTSSNTDLERATIFYCFAQEKTCNNCGAYSSCQVSQGCQLYNKIYASYGTCCEANGVGTPYYCKNKDTGACFKCGYNSSECTATGLCNPSTIKRSSC